MLSHFNFSAFGGKAYAQKILHCANEHGLGPRLLDTERVGTLSHPIPVLLHELMSQIHPISS